MTWKQQLLVRWSTLFIAFDYSLVITNELKIQ